MKTSLLLSLILAAGLGAARAADRLTNQHVDVGVGFEDGRFDLHVHNETDDVEYDPRRVILQVNAAAKTQVPADPAFGFLGAPGSEIWVLPQVQDPNLLFLGIGAEEIEAGVFEGDSLILTLRRVKGPGRFTSFTVDAFGRPVVHMNPADGISPATDSVLVLAGGHSEYNWSFTRPGTYRIEFFATGVLADGRVVRSKPVTYRFFVEKPKKHGAPVAPLP
jgi:surface-anchored protein